MNSVYEKDYTTVPASRKLIGQHIQPSSFIDCIRNVLTISNIDFTIISESENESAWCQTGFYLVTESENSVILVEKYEEDITGWLFTKKQAKSKTLKRWRLIPIILPITFTLVEEEISTQHDTPTTEEILEIDIYIPQLVALTFEDGEIIYAEEESVASDY